MNMTNQEKRNEQRGVPGWLELYDLSLHSDVEARTPIGAYIRGLVDFDNHRFEPSQKTISGKPIEKPLEIDGTPGWVELRKIQFHGDIEAIQPSKPYMHGLMDRENHFYPDGLLVS